VEISTAAPPTDPSWDRPGGLGIKEQRAWATWQLAVTGLIFLLVGMIIGYSGKKPGKAPSSTAARVSLVPAGGTSTPRTSTTVANSIEPGPAATTATTAAPSVATSSNSATLCNAPKATVLPNTPGSGPSDLPTFDAPSAWCIGWIFDCSASPGGAAPFMLSVVSTAGAATNAVTEDSRQGNGIVPETGSGTQHLRVTADPGCKWAIKVTSA
jgi:hypothetical protein